MSEYHRPPGKTTVSPEVLITIARMAALSVPGVSGMAPIPGGAGRLFRRVPNEGVRMSIEENAVVGDIFLIVKENVNIRDVGRDVQQQVSRAIKEMVGMEVVQLD